MYVCIYREKQIHYLHNASNTSNERESENPNDYLTDFI